jgi:hypothetical protein
MVLLEDNFICLVEGQLPRVRASTAATLQNELVETTETRISTETTLNRLHEREFNTRKPANVPLSHKP